MYNILNENGEPFVPAFKGDDGKSVYEIAVENGFVGTEEQWLESLKGTTPDIQVGTVTTLEPNKPATVTRTGTDEEPVFDFGIPKGNYGDSFTEVDIGSFGLATLESTNEDGVYTYTFTRTGETVPVIPISEGCIGVELMFALSSYYSGGFGNWLAISARGVRFKQEIDSYPVNPVKFNSALDIPLTEGYISTSSGFAKFQINIGNDFLIEDGILTIVTDKSINFDVDDGWWASNLKVWYREIF